MQNTFTHSSALLIALAVSLAACKKVEQAPAAAVVVAAPAATAPAAPAAAPVADATTPAASAAAPAGPAFDVASVPVTSKPLPPFPYLSWPAALEKSPPSTVKGTDFDRVYLVAGSELKPVEGKVERRHFTLSDAKWSRVAAERNYETALKDMGATLVNTVQPSDKAFLERHPEMKDDGNLKMQVLNLEAKINTYLLRTPQTNVWIITAIDDYNVSLVAIEEKALVQSVKPLSAAQMATDIKDKGHVALYLNFETDKAQIREQDQPVMGEVNKLLVADAALKLTIEGHTDNSGDRTRNRQLSQDRAAAVRDALVASGIDKLRLAAVGLGDSKPLADNGDAAGRAKNRRVELVRRG